ncbi:DNA ligase, partial [Thermococci archaeon]
TSMFPDLVKDSLDSIKPDKAIIDGELVAINPETGKPMPFQEVLRRRRKYNIEEVSRELPIQFHAFDVLYSEGVEKIDLPYEERRKTLEEIIEQKEGKFHVVERIISDDEKEIKDFLNYSLSLGHEGLLAKDLNSPYRVGKREFLWLKVKPGGDTLDLVVVGAFYGKGKRAGVFGSYLLAARDEESDKLLTVSKLGSGFTDDELKELTEKFKSLVMKRKPGILEAEIEPHVWIEPKIVFEVMFEEIQKSPEEKHTSGFGLRFPRFVRIREDKGVEEISTIQEIEEMYRKQEEKKGGVSPLSSSS